MKAFWNFTVGISLLALLGCENNGVDPIQPDPPLNFTGVISGIVTDAFDGTPIAGARIETSPATTGVTTDGEGKYIIPGIEVSNSPTQYRVIASKEGFKTVSGIISLARSTALATLDLALSDPERLPPGFRGAILDIRKSISTGRLGAGESITYEVDLTNAGSTQFANVVIHDSLDPGFGDVVTEESIRVNTELFPEATVTVSPSGQVFDVFLGSVPPTDGFVHVFTLMIPSPSVQAVYCNTASVRGQDAASEKRHTMCIV